MEIGDWLVHLGFAALMGMAGQFGRAVIGLKKLSAKNERSGLAPMTGFAPGQLVATLFVGALAGILAMLLLVDPATGIKASKELVVGLMAAGYSGTDFIEGALGKLLPGASPSAAPAEAPRLAPPASADTRLQSLDELMARHYASEPSYAPVGWAQQQPDAQTTGWR